MENKHNAIIDGSLLPPGFVFCPSEEELVGFFLQRKVCSIPIPGISMPEMKSMSMDPQVILEMKGNNATKDSYFFLRLPHGRITSSGYWKLTKISRLARESGGESILPAVKLTWLFCMGKAPDGKYTDWIMEEFRFMRDVMSFPTDYAVCRLTNMKNKECRRRRRQIIVRQAISRSIEAKAPFVPPVMESSVESIGNFRANALPSLSSCSASCSSVSNFQDSASNEVVLEDDESVSSASPKKRRQDHGWTIHHRNESVTKRARIQL